MYRIVNPEGEYWSNTLGWCDWEASDKYTEAELDLINMPLGGELEPEEFCY